MSDVVLRTVYVSFDLGFSISVNLYKLLLSSEVLVFFIVLSRKSNFTSFYLFSCCDSFSRLQSNDIPSAAVSLNYLEMENVAWLTMRVNSDIFMNIIQVIVFSISG